MLSFPLHSSVAMDSPSLNPKPHILSPSRSGRSSGSNHSNSPEFEFWMVRNPSCPQPNLLSADVLFVDGVILPLHLLPLHQNSDSAEQTPPPETPVIDPDPEPGPEISTMTADSASGFSASKRWRDIFKKTEKKNLGNQEEKEKEKEKEKLDKKKGRNKSGSRASSAELNINIWPFSRSRSAGNAGTRPQLFPGALGARKVSSAPCSRSNSAGESKSRKWPSSPGRPGVHLGRRSPVWQVRRGGSANKNPESVVRSAEKGSKKEGTESRRSKVTSSSGGGGGSGSAKARVLNLNVPMCIGYRHHLSCRSDENSAIGIGGSGNGRGNGGGGGDSGVANVGNGGNLFNLRSLFAKKNALTSH